MPFLCPCFSATAAIFPIGALFLLHFSVGLATDECGVLILHVKPTALLKFFAPLQFIFFNLSAPFLLRIFSFVAWIFYRLGSSTVICFHVDYLKITLLGNHFWVDNIVCLLEGTV